MPAMNDSEREAWILQLLAPWTIVDDDRDEAARRLLFWLVRSNDSPLSCPECGHECAFFDAQRRWWRCLDANQFQTVLEAVVPRCSCPEHGVNPIRVPWAESGNRVTGFVECPDPGCMLEAGRAAE